LCRNLDLIIEKGQRIAIVGANGIGKTTLLKTVQGLIPSLAGDIEFSRDVKRCYFAQDLYDQLDPNLGVLEILMQARPELGEPKARGVLGALLFRGDDVFKKFSVLSGGEKSRVGLAIAMSTKSNFLLLDEPTNHLDILSSEVLQQAVENYEGTSLIVSHNRSFLNALATHTLAIGADGQATLYHGNIDDYLRLMRQENSKNAMDETVANAKSTGKETKDVPQRAKKNQNHKEIRNLEKQLVKLEKQIERNKKILAENKANYKDIDSSDHQKLSEWQKRSDDVIGLISNLEETWLEVQVKLEDLS